MVAQLPGRSKGTGGTKHRQFRPMAEINVTPFVDVMLVLLVVFMVTAPLLNAGVPVDLPTSEAKSLSEESNEPIEISVTKNNEIFIGEAKIDRQKLIPLLSAMTEGNPDRRIYIRGDQALNYGNVLEVIGAINGAGFNKVALISQRPK